MNTAHNGICLGQVLYKVCDRLDIVDKVKFKFILVYCAYLITSRSDI